jgi:putative FmdB family regulatory protein
VPLYEYECDEHGHRFEVIQKFSDPPIEVCPTCGGHVHKVISSPAFQFKGSGWYVTDYAKKDSGGGKSGSESGDKQKSEKSESKETTSSTDKDSGTKKTDSTPDKSGT